jgi:transposase
MDKLQIEIKCLKRKLGTWSKVGNELGISRSHAWRVAHGKSDSIKARHYFDLPPKMVAVKPCRVCGEVHQQKTCAKQRQKRIRYRVSLEFNTWYEQQAMIDLLSMYGSDRKKQSVEVKKIIENFKVKV